MALDSRVNILHGSSVDNNDVMRSTIAFRVGVGFG